MDEQKQERRDVGAPSEDAQNADMGAPAPNSRRAANEEQNAGMGASEMQFGQTADVQGGPAAGTDGAEQSASRYEWTVRYLGKSLHFWACLLIAVLTAMVSILSTSTLNDNRASTVFIVFAGILVIIAAIYLYGAWGVLSAALAALLFCLTIRTSVWGILLNIAANTLQAFIIYLVFKFTDIDETVGEKNGVITSYKFIMLALGGTFVILSFLFDRFIILYVFFALLIAAAGIFSVLEKRPSKILFVLLVCILPSFAGGLLNSFFELTQAGSTVEKWYESAAVWGLSNSVLFGSFGYLLLGAMGRFKEKSARWQKGRFSFKRKPPREFPVKVASIIYYIATLLWNALFYVMYFLGWMQNDTPVYLFPWAVGNLFFIVNLCLSTREEVEKMTAEKAFGWFEQRAVVAENNTQMLIAVIAFLLPLCASYLGGITESIAFIFVLNITAAVISIGLIWIPKGAVRIMEIVKDMKTVFHLYTLSLLLLSAVMMVSNGTLGI